MVYISVNKHTYKSAWTSRSSVLIAIIHSRFVVKITYVGNTTLVHGISLEYKCSFYSSNRRDLCIIYFKCPLKCRPPPSQMTVLTAWILLEPRNIPSRRGSRPLKVFCLQLRSASGDIWCNSTSLVLRPSFWSNERNAKEILSRPLWRVFLTWEKWIPVNKIKTLWRKPINNLVISLYSEMC